VSVDIEALPPLVRARMRAAELARRKASNRIKFLFPADGPFARSRYPKHLAFFALGTRFKTRAFIAANRVGKTLGGGGYETVLHLTGDYPDWWVGHRFSKPVDCWAAGDTKETVRDIIQTKLVGPETARGTGLIPADCLGRIRLRPNGNGAIDTVEVKHVSGRTSLLGFKSYDQGRESFQGTEKDVIWLDEESDEGIRAECALRLMTTGGLLLETFTPLKGLTPIVMKYMEGGEAAAGGIIEGPDRAVVMAGWDDVPHLGEAEKARMLAESEPHLRDARSKGIPSMGAGAIYPVPEEDILVPDREIPAWWPRAYALDVGWKKTAALWGALDRETDTLYLYAEHYKGNAEPVIHASAIKAKGVWIPGVIDPASAGSSQIDGKKMLTLYRNEGLLLTPAESAVEAGLSDVWQRLSTGKLKVFKSLTSWLGEYRMYRRDEKGKIVKANDHLMDCTRYLVRSGIKVAKVMEPKKPKADSYRPAVPGVGM
jgi:phage terminase large subunit-like protein